MKLYATQGAPENTPHTFLYTPSGTLSCDLNGLNPCLLSKAVRACPLCSLAPMHCKNLHVCCAPHVKLSAPAKAANTGALISVLSVSYSVLPSALVCLLISSSMTATVTLFVFITPFFVIIPDLSNCHSLFKSFAFFDLIAASGSSNICRTSVSKLARDSLASSYSSFSLSVILSKLMLGLLPNSCQVSTNLATLLLIPALPSKSLWSLSPTMTTLAPCSPRDSAQ